MKHLKEYFESINDSLVSTLEKNGVTELLRKEGFLMDGTHTINYGQDTVEAFVYRDRTGVRSGDCNSVLIIDDGEGYTVICAESDPNFVEWHSRGEYKCRAGKAPTTDEVQAALNRAQ